MNAVEDWKMTREMDTGSGRWLRIDCLKHSPYSLFISRSQSSSFLTRLFTCRSATSRRRVKKSHRERDCGGERGQIEHPPLLCQSVSSVKHSSACSLQRGVWGPFHLTWLCKSFSLRPKGGECHRLDKVPISLMGPAAGRRRPGCGVKGEVKYH